MIERSYSFGDNGGLIGTLVEAHPGINTNAKVGFVFFNAGIVHRIGVHRTNVMLARRLAARGIPSIRFDFAGVGDSARADGRRAYAEQAVADIQAALGVLGEATGVTRFVLYGVCSGAVHGYAAALADERVAGVAMFDIYKYPTLKARLRHTWFRVKKHGSLRAVISRAAHVVKRLAVGAAGKLRKSSVPQEPAMLSNIGFFATRPPKAEFARGLSTLLNRGTKVLLMYAGSGFEHYNYDDQFKDAFKNFGITDDVETAFLRDVDHTATRLAAQAEIVACIERWAETFNVPPNIAR